MKKKTLSLSSYVYASFFLAAALVFVQLYLYLQYYDFNKSLWEHGTPVIVKGLPYIILAIIGCFAVAFALTAKNSREEDISLSHPAVPSSVITGGLTVLALILALPAQLFAIGSDDHLNQLLNPASSEFLGISAFFHALCLLLAIPAALYFLAPLRGKTPTVTQGIVTVLYFLTLTFRVYFDMNMLLNDPRWTFRIVSLVSILLFLLFDIHLLIGKKAFLFRLVAVLTLATSATSGFTALILTVSMRLPFCVDTTYAFVEMSMAFYMAVRLLITSKPLRNNDEAEETSGHIEEAAENSAQAVEEEGSDSEEAATDEAKEEEKTEQTAEPVDSEEAIPKEAPAENAPGEELGPVEETTAAEEPAETAESRTTAETEDLPDLTEDEVVRFYQAVLASLLKNKGITAPTEEDIRSAQSEAGRIISAILETEDRNERITAVRAVLAQTGL